MTFHDCIEHQICQGITLNMSNRILASQTSCCYANQSNHPLQQEGANWSDRILACSGRISNYNDFGHSLAVLGLLCLIDLASIFYGHHDILYYHNTLMWIS